MNHPQLCFPLDYATVPEALGGAREVCSEVEVLKIGLELFIEGGATVVRQVRDFGCSVFLDLKLHDIPETVERAVRRAVELEVDYLTVHASGGPGMLAAALRGAVDSNLTILAVTVLTSLSDADLPQIGIERPLLEHAQTLTHLAARCGVRGFVCSAREAGLLREAVQRVAPGTRLQVVTPGIRPIGNSPGDQSRVATPADAVAAGASMLVVGRPIRDASSPAAAARAIRAEMDAASRQLRSAPAALETP